MPDNSEIAFAVDDATIEVTDGPAVIQLVVPLELEEDILLSQLLSDEGARIRAETPQ